MFVNIDFYICWAVLSFLPLMFAFFRSQTILGKISGCLCALAFALLLTVGIFKSTENNDDCWNKGICSCGGAYEFSCATDYRYYYTCDTCGHTEEFSHLMK